MGRLTEAAAAAAAAAAIGGCGSDDGRPTAGPATTVPSGERLAVVGDEYSFDPSNVVVRGGGKLEIELRNEGSIAHNLRVFDGDREVGGTPTFPGGETRSGTVRLEPGRYRIVCTVGDHAELGMVGTLKVQ